MNTFSILRNVEVFGEFDDSAIKRLASATWVQEYSSGQVILEMGQKVEAIGVVVSGRVEIRLKGMGPERSVEISEGQLFGEMSLLTGEPAVANVVAALPSRVVHVPHEAITEEIGLAPKVGQRLAKLLAQRLVKRHDDPEEQAMVDRAQVERQSRNETSRNPVLVLNMGSSSIKYGVFVGGEAKVRGLVDRVGMDGTKLKHDGPAGRLERSIEAPDHEAGLRAVMEILVDPEHGAVVRIEELVAVGHRTAHGGERFTEATAVDEEVKAELRRISALAPLHNPIHILGIEICEKLLPPGTPQLSVFDTAFHMTMPEHAFRYALPRDLSDKHHLRRFGFHGTSHKYVTEIGCAFLGEPKSAVKLITCHLGNGASMAAVEHGRSVDTTMGLTPLEGLVMGTRSGDLDPGLVLHLMSLGMKPEEVDRMLNKESGLKGLSGLSSDMRELEKAADAGHSGALLAIQAFCYRVRKYIGAYTAAMGGLDAIVFTGGIGENGQGVRSRICHGLGYLGIDLDENLNSSGVENGSPAKLISSDESRVKILVVPTDEEKMIAQETVRSLERSGVTRILKARRDRPVPIGVSAHHVHLSQNHLEQLFGKGHALTIRSELSQPGQYVCEEQVDLIGPKGRVDRVRILAPVRPQTQVEISRTEEFKLGIDAPIRASGDLKGSPGLRLVGPNGELKLEEGVICALRHIHMSPENALAFGLRDRDIVRVEVEGERSLIFGDVLVRVHPDFRLEMHIDTDEANAAEISSGMTAIVESIQKRLL